MACETSSDNCPRPGDTDNILLRKILLALTSGAGVAGGQGIVETPGGVVNFAQSGPYTPGAIPFATSSTTMGFDPANLFWDDMNNFLGLGTSTPGAPLHVVSSAIDAHTLDLEVNNASVVGSGIRLRHSRGTQAVPLPLVNGDLTGVIAGQAFNDALFFSGAEIDFVVDGVVGAGRPPSRIEFYTNIAGGSQTEKLRLAGDGKFTFTVPTGVGGVINMVSAGTSQIDFLRAGAPVGFVKWGAALIQFRGSTGVTIGPGFGTGSLTFASNDIDRWQVVDTGVFIAVTDNTLDIGTSGAYRPRSIYVGTSVFTPQVQFPAAQVPSADPNNLDDYEEGSWTPTDASGAGLAFTIVAADCKYTKIGRQVTANFRLVFPVTASGLGAAFGGLPFTSAASAGNGGYVNFTNSGLTFTFSNSSGSTTFVPFLTSGIQPTNTALSTTDLRGTIVYFV